MADRVRSTPRHQNATAAGSVPVTADGMATAADSPGLVLQHAPCCADGTSTSHCQGPGICCLVSGLEAGLSACRTAARAGPASGYHFQRNGPASCTLPLSHRTSGRSISSRKEASNSGKEQSKRQRPPQRGLAIRRRYPRCCSAPLVTRLAGCPDPPRLLDAALKGARSRGPLRSLPPSDECSRRDEAAALTRFKLACCGSHVPIGVSASFLIFVSRLLCAIRRKAKAPAVENTGKEGE